MKLHWIIAGVLLLASVPVHAAPKHPAPKHTTAFDGHYSGKLTPSAALGAKNCPTLTVDDFVIDGGLIQPASAAPSAKPTFDGFVTDAGFITGHMHLGDSTVPFQARAEVKGIVTVISGGVAEETGACAWIVDLTIE